MLASKLRCVLIACALAGMLSLPSPSPAGPILDWLCGPSNMTAQTTYVQPYYATEYAPTYAAPTYAVPAGGCSSCAPQVVQYAPYTSYRPISVARSVTTYYYPGMARNTCAAPVTSYYPTSACSSCAAPFTAYYPTTACNSCARPITAYYAPVAWTQQVRLIPYSTYRMSYMPVTYVGYAPVYTGCASPCVSSCASPCGNGGCGNTVTYGASACDSCQPAVSSSYVTSDTQTPTLSEPITGTTPSTESTLQPKTFQEQKPAVEDTQPSLPENKTNSESELKPIPRPETQLNSLPEPRLIDPENRTTARPATQTIHLAARSATPVQPAPAPRTGGWREARD